MRTPFFLLGLVVASAFACGSSDDASAPAADGGVETDAAANDATTSPDAACAAPQASDLGTRGAIAIAGDPGGAPAGIGDPSFLYPAGAAKGFMTYTAVAVGAAHTRLATSSDKGATWTYVGEVNAEAAVTITTTDMAVCGASSCPGKWIHEVSSLVDDATDPDSARRYKVFTHSYFSTAANVLHYEIGAIRLWTSPTLDAGATWTETRILGWTSSSPDSSSGVGTVVTSDAKLAPLLGQCAALTEPGALVRGSTIDLAVGCVRPVSASNIPIEIVLLRSADHGQSWSPVAKVLDANDAADLGGAGGQINAAELVMVGGKAYVFATPAGPVTSIPGGSGYRGCYLFPLDIETGQVERCGGKAVVTRSIVGPTGLFHGACAYAEGASAAGVVYLSADTKRAVPFQFFPTGITLP